jgi:hypothetical protein
VTVKVGFWCRVTAKLLFKKKAIGKVKKAVSGSATVE